MLTMFLLLVIVVLKLIRKQFLYQKFTIKDLGYAKYFLGLEIIRSENGIFDNQRKYALDLVQDAGISA